MHLPDLVQADLPFLRALRQDLHAHPELGFEEERTSGIVASLLEEAGLAIHRGLGGTGVVGTLQCGDGKRAIGLRADMDALAMPETAERPYKSKAPGKMHACGHDGHTTLLLGAARYLARTRNFSGKVHFIFQPAEEGRGGAKKMVEDGLFGLFPCDAVYGLHNMPGLATDEMAVTTGPQLASSDTWTVTFNGIGTHGAKPHLGKDPITASGYFLTSLQTIVGRAVDPLQPAVVSACSIQAGDPRALNVIPDSVEIGGTARAYSDHVRNQLEREIERLARGVAAHVRNRRRVHVSPSNSPGGQSPDCDRAGGNGGANSLRRESRNQLSAVDRRGRFRVFRRECTRSLCLARERTRSGRGAASQHCLRLQRRGDRNRSRILGRPRGTGTPRLRWSGRFGPSHLASQLPEGAQPARRYDSRLSPLAATAVAGTPPQKGSTGARSLYARRGKGRRHR